MTREERLLKKLQGAQRLLNLAGALAYKVEQALPIIASMWEAFPYAEQDGDDEIMSELRQAFSAYAKAVAEEQERAGEPELVIHLERSSQTALKQSRKLAKA